jgi:hypothetical protein
MDEAIARFRQLCFLFVCNKLDEDEMAWMESTLRIHPQLQAEVDADRVLVQHARAGLAAQYQAAEPLVPFETVRALLGGPEPARPHPLRLWVQRWWNMRLPAPWVTGVAAMLAVVVAVQNRVEVDTGVSPYRGGEQVQRAGPMLKVIFDDRLSVGELRALLAAHKLALVRGPDEQGVVWLAVNEGGADQALAGLRANASVIDAQLAGHAR